MKKFFAELKVYLLIGILTVTVPLMKLIEKIARIKDISGLKDN